MTATQCQRTLGAVFGRAIIITGALLTAWTLQAQEGSSSTSHEHASSVRVGDTPSFLKEAGQMNNAVIKIAQLGAEKAQSSELKQYCQTLERDHKQAQEKLEKIADKHNVTLPTGLTDKCKEELSKLQGLSGSEFDEQFAKSAIQGHAMAMAHLREASTELKDSDVAQYAKDMLSEVKRHQERGREIAKAVGLDQATIAALEKPAPEGVGTAGTGSETSRGSGDKKETEHEHSDSPREP